MPRLPSIRLLFLLFLIPGILNSSGDERFYRFAKTADDDDRQYTNVGNIGLTVTNFGTIGTRNAYWPNQPSCEYPRGSRIEHIYQGGLWVGAQRRRTGEFHVSTGVSDQARGRASGYEFTNELGSTIRKRSSLPFAADFTPLAISHQDFVCEYSDVNRVVPATGDTILDHTPLGIAVRQESYAWNFPFADFFVILNYTIYNVGTDTLDSVYVGLWGDNVVRNTNLVRPFGLGTVYFNQRASGYDSLHRMAYSFDFTGMPGGPPADSYVAMKLLGSTPFPRGVDSIGELRRRTYFNAWQFRAEAVDPPYLSPTDDHHSDRYLSRYSRMTQSIPQQFINRLRTEAGNRSVMVSTGPLGGDSTGFTPEGHPTSFAKDAFYPGDSINVVFGIICAKKFGAEHASFDTPEQRSILYANADWAQRAYQGEDLNGNNTLEPGEDIVGRDDSLGLTNQPDGRLNRFLLPFPPRQPKVRAEVGDRQVAIYWDKTTAENSRDPITGEYDFEGYRIYRSNAGADFQSPETFLLNINLVGEFDISDNDIGRNTGFRQILLSEPKIFPDDTVHYWYRFPPIGTNVPHLNGWQYVYGISAFDRGDSALGLPSLESAMVLRRVIPGTPAVTNANKGVGVYPNPYYTSAHWDGTGERNRKIYFYNLPPRCEIRIYTLAGDVVAELHHDSETYTGGNIQWFQTHGDPQTVPQFAGGEHAWDLISRFDQAIASGLYLFTVKDVVSGDVQRGKFLVIK